MEKEGTPQANVSAQEIGQKLIEAREAKGYSAEDIAASLKLRPRQIHALESGEFDQLSGLTYIRGIIRNYAKLVEIDPAPLLAEIDQTSQLETLESACLSSEALSAIDMGSASGLKSTLSWRPNRFLIILALLAILAGFVIWAIPEGWSENAWHFASAQTEKAKDWWESLKQKDDLEVAEAEAIPMNIEPEEPIIPTDFLLAEPALADEKIPDEENNRLMGKAVSSPTPVSQANLKLAFSEDAWIEIKEGRNHRLVFSGFVTAGSERDFTASLPTELKVGNPKAVSVNFNGSDIALSPYTLHGMAHLLLQ